MKKDSGGLHEGFRYAQEAQRRTGSVSRRRGYSGSRVRASIWYQRLSTCSGFILVFERSVRRTGSSRGPHSLGKEVEQLDFNIQSRPQSVFLQASTQVSSLSAAGSRVSVLQISPFLHAIVLSDQLTTADINSA